MGLIQRVLADGRLTGTGPYSDAVIVDLGRAYQIRLAGIAAVDPTTKTVVGYESHNGTYAPDALEKQVADVFLQAERLLEAASTRIDRSITCSDLTAALVFLREDYPLAFQRFNDAYVAEFKKRGIAEYPARTTVLHVTLPEPNALVEIQFEAAVEK